MLLFRLSLESYRSNSRKKLSGLYLIRKILKKFNFLLSRLRNKLQNWNLSLKKRPKASGWTLKRKWNRLVIVRILFLKTMHCWLSMNLINFPNNVDANAIKNCQSRLISWLSVWRRLMHIDRDKVNFWGWWPPFKEKESMWKRSILMWSVGNCQSISLKLQF